MASRKNHVERFTIPPHQRVWHWLYWFFQKKAMSVPYSISSTDSGKSAKTLLRILYVHTKVCISIWFKKKSKKEINFNTIPIFLCSIKDASILPSVLINYQVSPVKTSYFYFPLTPCTKAALRITPVLGVWMGDPPVHADPKINFDLMFANNTSS